MSESNQRAAEPAGAVAPKRTWQIGTLVYSVPALCAVFFWLLLGDFAWSLRDRSVGPMAAWYLKHLEVPNVLFGLIMTSLPAVIGLILGPVISVKSDRHRGRMGRRIPFLLICTPIAAAGMVGIGLTPVITSWIHTHFPGQNEKTIAIVSFAVFWTAYEIASIAGQAVFGGLINDVIPRELIGRFYGAFRAVSLADGIIFNYWIMGKVPDNFTLIMCLIGIFYGSTFLWMCFKVKEGEYPPPPPLAGARLGMWCGLLEGVRTYFRECFTSKYYMLVFVMITLGTMTFLPVNAFAIPYARSLGVDMNTYGKCVAAGFAINFCLSFFLGWLADIFHPLRIAIAGMVLYVLVGLWGAANALDERTFTVAFTLHIVISGCYMSGTASLGQRLYPKSRYAQFASAAGMLLSFATMASGMIAGLAIDAAGGVHSVTFALGALASLIALITAHFVYRRWAALGGAAAYVAPE